MEIVWGKSGGNLSIPSLHSENGIPSAPSLRRKEIKTKKELSEMIKLLKQFATIAAFAVVFCGMGLSVQASPKKIAVAINSEYDFGGGYPFPGTFTLSVDGVVVTAGTVTMEVASNENGIRFHCLYRFTPTSGPVGTFIIREECVFAPEPDQGRWEIVSGTGAYENVKGNGSALMPGNQENWVGFLY